jgi:Ricin-type beta-trefoil lectin domain-like/Ricin-type beta-trefoil lectin domain
VVNVNSGKCLDVYQWGILLGTSLDQWTCGDEEDEKGKTRQDNQKWRFTPTDSGYYKVSSSYVLMTWNVTGGPGAVAQNVLIQLWSYGGNSNEQWKPEYLGTDANGNDIYRFRARNSGLCLDVPSASTDDGKQLQQYGCNNSNAQAFILEPEIPAAGSPILPQQPAPSNPPPSPSNPPPPPTVAPQPNQNLWYEVAEANSSDICVALPDSTTDEGTPLEALGCDSFKGSRLWQFRLVGKNLFAVTNNYVNLVWDVQGGPGSIANGVKIQGWGPFNGQKNEEWYAVYLGTDSNGRQLWEFIAASSGLCLTNPQSGSNRFQQNSCNNVKAQSFYLNPGNSQFASQVQPTTPSAPPPPPDPISGGSVVPPEGWGQIVNLNSRLCLDAAGGVAGNGVQLIQYPCGKFPANQEWRFVPTDNGWYKVENQTNTNMVMDIGAQLTNNGALMDTYQWNGQANQQFRPTPGPSNSGVWSLQARNSGKCVDLDQSSTAVNKQLQQYSCNGTPAQQFFFMQEYPSGGGGPASNPNNCRADGDPIECQTRP